MRKDIQNSEDLAEAQDEMPTLSLDSSPDIIIEHGSTRLSLDLDGWEWFWLFLAISFLGSCWIFFLQ